MASVLPEAVLTSVTVDTTRRRRYTPLDVAIIAVVVIIVLTAVIGQEVAPSSIFESHILSALQAPSSKHLLGTDAQGRDVLWRVIAGCQVTLLSSAAVVAGDSVIGVVIATLATVGPRWIDALLMGLTDLTLALPGFVLALGLAASLGPGLRSAIIAMIAAGWPLTARMLRGVMRETTALPFVEGARVLGVSKTRLMIRHVLPNSLDVLIVKWAFDIGFTVIVLSGLSFLESAHSLPALSGAPWWRGHRATSPPAGGPPWPRSCHRDHRDRVRASWRHVAGSAQPGVEAKVTAMTETTMAPNGSGTPPLGAPLLDISGLSITARSHGGVVTLVDGIELQIAVGERVAIVGESGSGKTVTARAIMRLDSALSVTGSVKFDGVDLLGLREQDMQKFRGLIGMIFQDPMEALNPLQTIGQQVTEPLRIRGVSRKQAAARACALLDELGVARAGDRMKAYPHEFSGGMRQRVVMAMALIGIRSS